MPTLDELRQTVQQQAQQAMGLHLAFIGISNGLFDALAESSASVAELAARTGSDPGYLQRWCEAAFAFGLLELDAPRYALSELGAAYRPAIPGTLMPFAVQTVLGAHMSERAAQLMKTGERPGEQVIAECEAVLPWFGPMLEASFGALFARELLPRLEVFRRLNEQGGTAVDLGCGNGWYLRRLLAHCPRAKGVGLDGFGENIRQATALAAAAGLGERASFRVGDIYDYTIDGQVELVAMSRALHHVWDQKERVFSTLHEALLPGGSVVIWEPRWPDDVSTLREPRRRAMAFQNLNEHVQGNHFLRPAEIEEAMRSVGLTPQTFLFADGNEAVVVGTRTI